MSNPSTEVLIVGSGPSGLILALTLVQNGVPVRVIEKTKTHRIGQRGAGLMPRSMETFEFLGLLDQVLKRAMLVPPLNIYKMPEGREVEKEFYAVPHLDPTPSQPYLNPLILGQDNLDKIIRAELEKLGCYVEIGVELKSFEQHEDHVKVKILKHSLSDDVTPPVEEEASYKWVIGADGARGVVRKQLGLSFLGETTEQRMITGDLMIEGLSPEKWHLWGDLSSVMASIRPCETEGLYNFILGGDIGNVHDISADENSFRQLLKKSTGNREDIKFGEVVCAFPYIINIRMVDAFKKGRVFVTGDAAHIHSPTGGQGMNTGVQDSFNLGWKLALVVKGLAPEALLETFNEERLPVVSEMLNITSVFLKKTIMKDNNEDAWNRTGSVNQLGVNYRGSSILVDEESEVLGQGQSSGSRYSAIEGHVHAGDRAPDAPGLLESAEATEPTRLFKFLKPTRHTVLIFADKVDHELVISALSSYPADLVHPIVITSQGRTLATPGVEVIVDKDGHAYSAYAGPDGTSGIFVVRPDGVIGARVGAVAALRRYFKGVFRAL